MTVGVVGFASLLGAARVFDSGLSAEAEAVKRQRLRIAEAVEGSRALYQGKARAIAQLFEVAGACAEAGWDGADAEGVHFIAVIQASDLIAVMPDDLPMPEAAAEPDGSISLDWIESRSRAVSVSVGVNNRLAYAWLDGSDRGHAVERFDGVAFPPRLLAAIRETVRRGGAQLRAA